MKSNVRLSLMAAVAGAIVAGGTSAAMAQSQPTPKGWSYEIRNGQRVPKGGNRVTNPDGSWREEIRQGSCVTIKERSASGEYKETRRCD